MGRFSGKRCRLVSMFWLTTLFFFIEILFGYITNSMALIADSFHMLSDVAALVVAFLSVKVSIILLYSFIFLFHQLYLSVLLFYSLHGFVFYDLFLFFFLFLNRSIYRCLLKNGQKIPLDGLELKF